MTVKDIYITDYTIHNLKVKKLSKKRFFSDFLLRGGFYAEQNFAKISNTKTIWVACVSYINYNCNSTFSTVYHNGGAVFSIITVISMFRKFRFISLCMTP